MPKSIRRMHAQHVLDDKRTHRMVMVQVEAGEYDSMQTGLLRGPYLAQVDLAWRRYRLRLDAPSVLASAMLAYFKRFRRKPVVPQDLRKYAVALPRESAVWLAAALADERRSMSSEVRCPPTCPLLHTSYVVDLLYCPWPLSLGP